MKVNNDAASNRMFIEIENVTPVNGPVVERGC